MFSVISSIANQVNRDWAQAGYRLDHFPDLAAEALTEHLPPDFSEVAAALSGGMSLPQQRRLDQSFGQPALTLYYDDRFVVEALCWHSGSPAIHQHSFSGAFRVMTGRSVHSRYRFTGTTWIAPTVAVGHLDLVDVEILNGSSVTSITAGGKLIHSAFHLDNPSMTVIVRTHDTGEPEYTYLPPGVAYDPSARTETLHKRLQMLDTLAAVEHPTYPQCLIAALDSADVYEGLELLLRASNHPIAEPQMHGLIQRYANRLGTYPQPVLDAVREQKRRSQLLSLRATVRDGDVRFVLACLLNAFDRQSFSRQLKQGGLVDGNADVLAECLRRVLGMSVEAVPVLSLAGTAMLDGLKAPGFSAWVASQSAQPIDHDQARLLDTLYGQMIESPLLKPLYT